MVELYSQIINAWNSVKEKSNYPLSNTNCTELWDKSASTYDNNMGSDQKRLSAMLKALLERNLIDKNTTVADIGCGTGCFSLPLSKHVKTVYAIDNSKQMLNIVASKETKNIVPIVSSFEDILNNKYDVVVCSYVPITYNEKSILALIDMAKKGGLFAVNSGKSSNEKAQKLRQLLFKENTYSNGMDIIYPFNIMYLKGLRPKIEYVDSSYTVNSPYETFIEEAILKYSLMENVNKNYKKIITDFVLSNSKDGIYSETTNYTTGIITFKK